MPNAHIDWWMPPADGDVMLQCYLPRPMEGEDLVGEEAVCERGRAFEVVRAQVKRQLLIEGEKSKRGEMRRISRGPKLFASAGWTSV